MRQKQKWGLSPFKKTKAEEKILRSEAQKEKIEKKGDSKSK